MRTISHNVEFCVVGGGIAGMCAAVSAARRGIKTVLMHDRPVLGGNASSEIRMWICGAHGENNRETGIIEEIQLNNHYYNPDRNYSIWDSILYGMVINEPNITMLLNCSCNDVVMDGNVIKSVKGWQLTSETWHEVNADIFADCSGDSILAPLTGAEFRYGREASSEFGETVAPPVADDATMGMSCLIQARQMRTPQKFIPPSWAYKYDSEADLPHRDHNLCDWNNFWWMEIGGTQDTIHDTEAIRDELLKIAFGVWDHIKNHGNHDADKWALDWVGFLPGKRESRRYVGPYILTQHDVQEGRSFDDIIAYGGWTIDDHHPDGFNHPGHPTIHYHATPTFGIPYRSLYSKNIDNLLFAGRNISATHTAICSTRVMGTCATLGQAVGTAASIMIPKKLRPSYITAEKKLVTELQQALLDDDSYLPGVQRVVSQLTRNASLKSSSGDPEPLRNGFDRIIGNSINAWVAAKNDWIEYDFAKPEFISSVRIVFDSNLNRNILNSKCYYPIDDNMISPPETLVRDFVLEFLDNKNNWCELAKITNNFQRLVRISINMTTSALRLRILKNRSTEAVNIFAFEVR